MTQQSTAERRRRDAIESVLALPRWRTLPYIKEIEDYVLSGNAASLSTLKCAPARSTFRSGKAHSLAPWFTAHFAEALAPPASMGEKDLRLLDVLLGLGDEKSIAERWFNASLGEEAEKEDFHAVLRDAFRRQGLGDLEIALFTIRLVTPLARDDWPNSAGRYLIQLGNDVLGPAIRALKRPANVWKALDFILDYVKRRLPSLTNDFFDAEANPDALPGICRRLINRGGPEYEEPVVRVFDRLKDDWQRFQVRSCLADFNPEKYREDALNRARRYFEDRRWVESATESHCVEVFLEVTSCMVRHMGNDVLEPFLPFLSVPEKGIRFDWHWEEELLKETRNALGGDRAQPVLERVKSARSSPSDQPLHETLKRIALNKSVKHLGRESLPAVIAAIDAGDLTTRLEGCIHLLEHENEDFNRIIGREIRHGLAHGGEIEALRFLGLVRHLGVELFVDEVLGLLNHRMETVRADAIRALREVGEMIFPGVETALRSCFAAHRLGAVQLLLSTNTARALRSLRIRLRKEEDDDVRRAIVEGLERAARSRGRVSSIDDLAWSLKRAKATPESFQVRWLDGESLPPLHFLHGKPLDAAMTRFILFRQSRIQEVRPDGEARPLYDFIDKGRSGDFAARVLEAFLDHGAPPGDRWALAIAGILGDDRCAERLARQVDSWVKRRRGKMAQCAVRALGLLGSDRALRTINSMITRFRTKHREVGRVALEAFSDAAEQRGLTPEELADRTVPWLGFELDRPRICEYGRRVLRVSVGDDFKLRYYDEKKNRALASLPRTAPRRIRQKFRHLAASLREAGQRQSSRLETLLVAQYRWHVAEWSELFPRHPVLFPFAARMVWGVYDDALRLTLTFRARDDVTLTNAADENVELPGDGLVGLVHLLELEPEDLLGWMDHLERHTIQSPFPQLKRRVRHLAPGHEDMKTLGCAEGTTLRRPTFHARAERLGWRCASIEDAGVATTWAKSFPAAGLDACLNLESLRPGDARENVRLSRAYFLRGGSIRASGNDASLPGNEEDPRLIALGGVPAVVLSEVMVDLERLGGRDGGC